MKFRSTEAGPIMFKKNKGKKWSANSLLLSGPTDSKTEVEEAMYDGDELISHPRLRSEPQPELIAYQFVKKVPNSCVTSDRCSKGSRRFSSSQNFSEMS